MSTPPGEYYTQERWQNWLDRLQEEELDPENEDSARLLLNLQDDAAIAVAKVLTDREDGGLNDEGAVDELAGIREIVLSDVAFEEEEKEILIDGVQTSLVCVFYAAEQYILDGAPDGASVAECIQAASDAEAEDDVDAALEYCAQAGACIIDGGELDIDLVDELEYGLVAEWVNGLDSLHTAMRDPEVVETEEEA